MISKQFHLILLICQANLNNMFIMANNHSIIASGILPFPQYTNSHYSFLIHYL